MNCNYLPVLPQHDKLADSYFEIDVPQGHPPAIDLIIPDCMPGLMIVEEGAVDRLHDQCNQSLVAGKIYLFGQKTKSVLYQYQPRRFRAHGYKLLPSALYIRFGISAEELTDTFIEIDDATLAHAGFITNVNRPSAAQKESLLLESILHLIHLNHGNIDIQQISSELNCGYKKMERLFKRYIGLTPKLYARIIRFNYSIKLSTNDLYTLTDIAYQAGFFDQNHFIRETKTFTNQTPKSLLQINKLGLEESHLGYLASRSF